MNKSNTIKELSSALQKAQAEMPVVVFDATNPFLKNKFASLGAVINTSRPILAKHGLSVSQFPTSIDGSVGVTTILAHSSGEWMEDTICLPLAEEKGKSAAQVAGSVITYLRRYSWAAVLGLYADEDTDGNQPEKKQAGSKKDEPKKDDNDAGPVTAAAWEAWGELLKRAQKVNVPFDEVKRAEINLGQLRARYKELDGFVKQAEDQAKAGA